MQSLPFLRVGSHKGYKTVNADEIIKKIVHQGKRKMKNNELIGVAQTSKRKIGNDGYNYCAGNAADKNERLESAVFGAELFADEPVYVVCYSADNKDIADNLRQTFHDKFKRMRRNKVAYHAEKELTDI